MLSVSTKGTKRDLDKLESVISMKNLRRSGILSDNLHDEVGDSLRTLEQSQTRQTQHT